MAITWKKLAYEDDVVTKALFDANTILAADSDNVPVALEIAEQRVLGRITAGNIVGLTAAQILTLIGVTAGADVTGDNPPQAHEASHKDGQTDEILLNEFGEPTAAVPFDGQQATDLVLHTVANAAARPTAVVGKAIFQTDELSVYVCTVSV